MTHNLQHLQKKEGTDERYTPKWVFDALGLLFDMDVAAPVQGPVFTPCVDWFHIDKSGLDYEWHGLVWMNPPYSKPKPWASKFAEHNNGIALLPTSQGKWWLDLWFDKRTKWLPLPSIRFCDANGSPMKNTAPWRSWLCAMGEISHQALGNFYK